MSRDLFKDMYNVKFIVKLGESGSEVVEMLKAVYNNQTVRPAGVYKLIKKFGEGMIDDTEDDFWEDRSSKSRTDEDCV